MTAGVIAVVAPDCIMTTAATDVADRKGSFSNFGDYVFVDAPGVNVFTPYPGGYYSIVSGTSFSAPAIARTAALIRSLRTTGVANSVAGFVEPSPAGLASDHLRRFV